MLAASVRHQRLARASDRLQLGRGKLRPREKDRAVRIYRHGVCRFDLDLRAVLLPERDRFALCRGGGGSPLYDCAARHSSLLLRLRFPLVRRDDAGLPQRDRKADPRNDNVGFCGDGIPRNDSRRAVVLRAGRRVV